MTERKNILQNLLEKPRQIIADIKTRRQEQLTREAEWWERYVTTPPLESEPTRKSYQENWGAMGGFKHIDLNWDPESKRWINVGQYIVTGYGPH